MWLEDTVVLANLVDGAVAAAVGPTGTTLVYAERLVAFDPRARWALRLWKPLAQFGPDLIMLAAVLVRALRGGDRVPGALRAVRFEPTGGLRGSERSLRPGHRGRLVCAQHDRARRRTGQGSDARPSTRSSAARPSQRRPPCLGMNEWVIAAVVLLIGGTLPLGLTACSQMRSRAWWRSA